MKNMNGIDAYVTISEGRIFDSICYVYDRDGKISGAESEMLRDIAGSVYGRIHSQLTVVEGGNLDKSINNARESVVTLSRVMRDNDGDIKMAMEGVKIYVATLDTFLKECSMN